MTTSNRRLTVVHTMRDWGLPSERFVVDLVRSMTQTRPVVVCGVRHARPVTGPLSVPVTALHPVVSRLPPRRRPRALRALIAAATLRRRAGILHSHFGYWAAHTAAVAEKRRLPWVLSLHGHDVLVDWERELEPDRVRTADLVIVPSQFLADAVADRGFREDRIRVIPSGLDLDRYMYRQRELRPDGEVRVTFIGRFVAKKGVLDAARAMAGAAAQGARLRCRFVGYGPLLQSLRDELRRLDLD